MQIIRTLTAANDQPLALTIGNFDGVHIGHRAILEKLVIAAEQSQFVPAAMTFAPHAKVFFGKATDFLINSDAEKAELIAEQGIQTLFQIPFDDDFSRMTPEAFVEALIDDLNVKFLLVGDDFRFGYQGRGDFSLLSRVCEVHDVAVQHTPTIRLGDKRVSSSRVRQAIKASDFATTEMLLGRRLTYRGEVITGKKLGRQINFPTANVRLPQTRLLPDGVFAVRVTVNKQTYGGMCNIGTKPTVDDTQTRQIEVHLFDFNNDLYGQTIVIEPLAKIRDEQQFSNVDKLVVQLGRDKLSALKLLANQL